MELGNQNEIRRLAKAMNSIPVPESLRIGYLHGGCTYLAIALQQWLNQGLFNKNSNEWKLAAFVCDEMDDITEFVHLAITKDNPEKPWCLYIDANGTQTFNEIVDYFGITDPNVEIFDTPDDFYGVWGHISQRNEKEVKTALELIKNIKLEPL
jgi:hypothetical protein